MSGSARRRGKPGNAGRGAANDPSDTSSLPSGPGQSIGAPAAPRGGFDGPASRGSASGPAGSQSRRGSNVPSVGSAPQSQPTSPRPGQGPSQSNIAGVVGSQPPSRAGVQPAPTAPMQGDPARDGPAPKYTDQMRNIDLPPSFYNYDKEYKLPTEFKKRPGFNTTGKAVQVALNSYPVTQFPNVKVHQYDVAVGSGAEKRMVIKKAWGSAARKQATGQAILFDGNKLAWAKNDFAEKRILVDLDDLNGPPAKEPGRNTFRISIKKAKVLDIGTPIQSYLSGQSQMGIEVLEAINFLDHLLRETPSTSPNFITVKRQFFTRNGQRMNLGKGVEVIRGVYQSLRLAEGAKLILNLDVANCCFWAPGSLTTAMIARFGLRDVQNIIADLRAAGENGNRRPSDKFKLYSRSFKKVLVTVDYKGCFDKMKNKQWNIKGFTLENAKERMLELTNKQTKVVERRVSVYDYFREKYNVTIQFWQLPLVEMTKKGVLYPMEFLSLVENQRYMTKLDEVQTANMIKFAVAPPSVREKAINEGKGWLNWAADPIHASFGLKVNPEMTKSNARLLPAPGVKFGGNKIEQPGTKGRWDLRAKKFLTPNPTELVAWGVGLFTNGRLKPDRGAIDNFVAGFCKAYRDHGGKVSNKPPNIMPLPNDPGQAVEQLHQATGNIYQRRPQLLVFLVQDKNSFHYLRIKKSCDARYGVVSQVMQIAQVLKGNSQYYSNVLMKVNAKLGGCTSQAIPHASSGFKGINEATMFIGADVSHASPGSQQASMAAVTVSFDRFGGRYAAACQTNGQRVEMISEDNWKSMLKPLVTQWISNVGTGQLPKQVYYFRDGVSEGQFQHVMQQEVPHIKSVLASASQSGAWTGKLTVVIAAKRHHIRAFPAQGGGAADPKGNPLPGILVEHDVTTPFEWDFYLYSHIALQGTSRPVHYTILHDERGSQPNEIQNMIYEHCYQYMRSTTSVSLFPAVYYAHLASNRAKARENVPSSDGPQGGAGFKQNVGQPSSDGAQDSEIQPLMPMFNTNGIVFAMWYI